VLFGYLIVLDLLDLLVVSVAFLRTWPGVNRLALSFFGFIRPPRGNRDIQRTLPGRAAPRPNCRLDVLPKGVIVRGYLRSLDKGWPVAIFNLKVEYMTTPVLDLAFAALSDPTRREIVQRLAKGAARVTDLVQPFDMSFNAVSKHVKVLERAGLVRRTRAGREHHIALDPEPIRRIAGWASRYERFWSDRLDKLEAFLKANRKGD